ncbi:MAG: hypothetical protein ACOYB2_18980, partial [Limnohabitans sp.]
DMVGVVGSSPIAPTKFGRYTPKKHLAKTLSAFFWSVLLRWVAYKLPTFNFTKQCSTQHGFA